MEHCCAMCCPHPGDAVINPIPEGAGRWRKALLCVVWGEVVAVVCKMILFDPMHGLFAALAIWIDYLGYATMHFCQTMFVCFMGGMDLSMLILQFSSKTYRDKYMTDDTKKYMLYGIFAFEICKVIIGWGAYASFRSAFYAQFGHSDPCGNPNQGGDGYAPPMRTRSLFTPDEESSAGGAGGSIGRGGGFNQNRNLYAGGAGRSLNQGQQRSGF